MSVPPIINVSIAVATVCEDRLFPELLIILTRRVVSVGSIRGDLC